MENEIGLNPDKHSAAPGDQSGEGGSEINLPNPGIEVPTDSPQPSQPEPGDPVPVEQ